MATMRARSISSAEAPLGLKEKNSPHYTRQGAPIHWSEWGSLPLHILFLRFAAAAFRGWQGQL